MYIVHCKICTQYSVGIKGKVHQIFIFGCILCPFRSILRICCIFLFRAPISTISPPKSSEGFPNLIDFNIFVYLNNFHNFQFLNIFFSLYSLLAYITFIYSSLIQLKCQIKYQLYKCCRDIYELKKRSAAVGIIIARNAPDM